MSAIPLPGLKHLVALFQNRTCTTVRQVVLFLSMKVGLALALGLALVVGIILYVWNSNKQKPQPDGAPADSLQGDSVGGNAYADLRTAALHATPQQLKLSLPAAGTVVFGIVMDWDLGSGIATVVSFQTGDASMYLSTGGGTIGGIQHESVRTAALRFVAAANESFALAKPSADSSGPAENGITFFFLTNRGRYMAREQMRNIESGKSPMLPLFEAGNDVISEIAKLHEGQE
jgi:hypothetical protein